MSRERGILFSAPMVRAILEGRKTVTRRVVKPQPSEGFGYLHPTEFDPGVRCWTGFVPTPRMLVGTWTERKAPYRVGDRLYVRETWGLWDQGFDTSEESSFEVFKADIERPEPKRWYPSIHMPKEIARIWLEVTAVRVERLQDITEEQARAEGVQWWPPVAGDWRHSDNSKLDALPGFMGLWDGFAKPGTRWADNPWVWVVEFKRIEREAAAT